MVLNTIQRKGEEYIEKITLPSILVMFVLDWIEFFGAWIGFVIVTLIEWFDKRSLKKALWLGFISFLILLIPTFATSLIIGIGKIATTTRRK